MKNKKAAMEMSVGTIVTIVLLMSVLILGLVLIQRIFIGAKYNVEQINDKVKDEINKLFTEGDKLVIYLPNGLAEIKQDEQWGVAFAVYAKEGSGNYKWKATVADSDINEKCGVSATDAEKWLITGREGNMNIASGSTYYDIVRVRIPEGAVSDVSKCIVRYQLAVTKADGAPYETRSFDIDVI